MSNKLQMADQEPWYQEGLSFKCTGCGKCCTGSPGYVWVDEQDIESMSQFLNISIDLFRRKYLRQKNGRYSLIELKSKGYDCIFLEDNKCSIYPVRPIQCRTYPWWLSNLSSKEAWEKAAEICEGIQPEAPTVELETIKDELAKMCQSTKLPS